MGIEEEVARQVSERRKRDLATALLTRLYEERSRQPMQGMEDLRAKQTGLSGVLGNFRDLMGKQTLNDVLGKPGREAPPMKNSEALLQAMRIYGPGTPEFIGLEQQLRDIQMQDLLSTLAPAEAERLGLPERLATIAPHDTVDERGLRVVDPGRPAVELDDLRAALGLREGLGKGLEVRTGGVADATGKLLGEAPGIVDPVTGKFTPAEGAAPTPTGGGGMFFYQDEDGNLVMGSGLDEAFDPTRFIKKRGDTLGDAYTQHEEKGVSLQQIGLLADRITQKLRSGNLKGLSGRTVADLRSATIQATQGLRIAGFSSPGDWLESLTDRDSWEGIALEQGALRSMELSLALLRAKSQSGENVSREELKSALEANKDVFSGDPDASEAALRETIQVLLDGYNLSSERFRALPGFDTVPTYTVEDIAPMLFENRPVEPVSPNVKSGEMDEISWDELSSQGAITAEEILKENKRRKELAGGS